MDKLLKLPPPYYPYFVLDDNLLSWCGVGIKRHTHGAYNHFMVCHKPGYFASQGWTYREVAVRNFLVGHRLKIFYNELWDMEHRKSVLLQIRKDLRKPLWKRVYDPVAIIGQYFGIDWLQIPGIDICSDAGEYIGLLDENYNLECPSPTDINQWLMAQPPERGYKILRYAPDAD